MARLKANKFRQKQKKIFQNLYSVELIICTLRKSKPYETSILGCPLKLGIAQYLAMQKENTCEASFNVHVL